MAKKAGEITLSRDNIEIFDKETKDNHVTSIDLKVQDFLKENLLKILPNSSFEKEKKDYNDRSKEYYWIVDPIDGTTNYIRKIPISVTSIALIHKNEPILGVVYNPFTNELFYAEKGKGAFKNGKKIQVSNRPFKNCIFCTSWGSYDKTQSEKSFKVSQEIYFKCEDIRRLGAAAYEICTLAEGVVDIFFEPILYPWDHAAASVVLTEAGGIISNKNECANIEKRDLVIASNNEENYSLLKEIVSKYY